MLKRLLSSPGSVATTLLTLLLGIGVNVSMLSLVDALIYREAPFPRAEQLVLLSRYTPQNQTKEFSVVEFLEVQNRLGAGASITAFSRHQGALSDVDHPTEYIDYVSTSPELFFTLETSPQLGRPFTASEVAKGRTDIVLISHTCWQNRFGGDSNIIGYSMRLGEESVTIIGVMPASFEWAKLWGFTQLWRPLAVSSAAQTDREERDLTLIVRHSLDTSTSGIETALDALATTQRANDPQHYETAFRYRAEPIQVALTHQLTGQISWLLTGLAGFVLLIACANLANLQLARSSERTKEFAIRLALGSTRGQLLRQQLAEPLLLAAVGGLLGLIAATGFNHVIANRLLVHGSANPLALELNAPIIGAAFLLALLTGLAFGLVPAWSSTLVDPNNALKSQDRGSTGNQTSRRFRHGLIVAEIALALILLSGATAMQRGVSAFTTRAPGWDSHQMVSAPLPLSASSYQTPQARLRLFDLLERKLPELPGVMEAAVSTSLPTFGYSNIRSVFISEQNSAESATHSDAFHVIVSSRYFAALGIPLRQGRTFPADISRTSPPAVVINASLARHLWPDENPIGQQLASMENGQPKWAEVIGVVNDVATVATLTEPATPFTVYKPTAHENWDWILLTLRCAQPATQIEPLRKMIQQVAPDLVIGKVFTTDQLVDRTLHNLRIATQVLSLFGLLGLGLSTVGIYGLVAHLVSQRKREFGIRMALGSRPRDLIGLVLRQGAKLVSIGVGLGLAGAFGLNLLLHQLMPRFIEIEFFALIGVAVFLTTVALLACLLPARRATLVDPAIALHED